MKRLAGHIFDSYDDDRGEVIRSVFGSPGELPALVKTAARLNNEQLDSLPDDQFAVILFDGTDKLRKYATVDAGNTLLSVLYLVKQAHLLPPEVVKTAARNLIGACEMHGIDAPPSLKIAAMTGTSPVSGKSQTPYAKGAKVNKIQWPISDEPKESFENPQLGKHDGAWDDVSERTNATGSPGSNFMELPQFSQKEKVKTAHAAAAQEVAGLFNADARVKQQSWRETPYFDITGWDPSQAGVDEAPAPQRTLLDGSYPIDGYDQVKTASVYFTDNIRAFSPQDRHRYCVKLASRMSELGMAIPEDVARYGSETYASDVDSYVEARRSYVHEEYQEGLNILLEKRAQVSPHVFAEALAEFDRMSNLNWYWDGQIPDPWYSTFGPSLEKIAEENWSYNALGTRIDLQDLEVLARNGHERLCKSFGADFAKEFSKSPKAVFESLPEPNKIIVARLASDRHAGTYTE